jgi:hypothetical protein
VEAHDTVHSGRKSLIMRRDQRCTSLASHEVQELGKYRVRRLLIEVSGWLIGKHERRLVGQRTGNRDPLLFAAG